MNTETITETITDPPPGSVGAAAPTTPEQKRTVILNAIGAGFNTIRILREKTGYDEQTLIREIEILDNLYIVTLPGPPVLSYWIKGRQPKHGVFIKDGQALPKPAPPKAERRQPTAAAVSLAAAAKKSGTSPEAVNPAFAPLADETGLPEPVIVVSGSDEYCAAMPLVLLIGHPDNPRGTVNEDEPDFEDLTNSIRVHGVQQPLVVTRIKNSRRFRIIIGHRRARAARRAGLGSVPVVIRSYRDAPTEYSVMLVENIQRQDLNAIQEARAFSKLYHDLGKDIHAAARAIGAKQSYLSSRMRLLALDVGIQIMIERGELGSGAGEILAGLDRDQQLKMVPRAQRMRLEDLRVVAAQMKNSRSLKLPEARKKAIAEKRVTTDDEKFTRSGSLKLLDSLGDGAWVSTGHLKQAFDDVCIDSCLESKDQSICNGCPVPRLIASLVRRQRKSQD